MLHTAELRQFYDKKRATISDCSIRQENAATYNAYKV